MLYKAIEPKSMFSNEISEKKKIIFFEDLKDSCLKCIFFEENGLSKSSFLSNHRFDSPRPPSNLGFLQQEFGFVTKIDTNTHQFCIDFPILYN